MSKEERLEMFAKIQAGMRKATVNMLIRKIKLGESVITADAEGNPIEITAEEALLRLMASPLKEIHPSGQY